MTTISTHEYTRLRGIEATWEALFAALKSHTPDCFSQPYISGRQCALMEIVRLQQIEKLVDRIEIFRD
jgi:hypothetical protein